jgi:hypothetical protein
MCYFVDFILLSKQMTVVNIDLFLVSLGNYIQQMAIHFPALTQALQLQIAELRKGRRYRRGNY